MYVLMFLCYVIHQNIFSAPYEVELVLLPVYPPVQVGNSKFATDWSLFILNVCAIKLLGILYNSNREVFIVLCSFYHL